MSIEKISDFKGRFPLDSNSEFQVLFKKAVELAHFEEKVSADEWYVATERGDIRWMHRQIADHVVARHLFKPAVIRSIPYVIDLLVRFSRAEASMNNDALALAIARCEEEGGSFQTIADDAFLRYSLGVEKHRRGMISNYLGYLSAMGRMAYCRWADGNHHPAGFLMAEAFRPLGDVVRSEIASRMFR